LFTLKKCLFIKIISRRLFKQLNLLHKESKMLLLILPVTLITVAVLLYQKRIAETSAFEIKK
jgi:hypothetical protein